jgi:hypothetical protein
MKLGPFLSLKKINFKDVELDKELNEEIENLPNYTDLDKINKKLSAICEDLKEKAKEENQKMKWKYAATCLDKLFFYLTTIGFVASFASTILASPKFYQKY